MLRLCRKRFEYVQSCSVKPDTELTQRISESPNVFLKQASAKTTGCRAPPCPESLRFDCADNRAISRLGLCAATLANHRVENHGDCRFKFKDQLANGVLNGNCI